MSSDNTAFQPGRAEVTWPDQVAAWGREKAAPVPDDEIPWVAPGTPPWATQEVIRPGKGHLPAWAVVSIVLGALVLCLGGSVALTVLDNAGPVPVVKTVPVTLDVTVTGTCEKKVIGEYGLVATVTATNATRHVQEGTIWVRWPVTGEAAQGFTRRVKLQPGQVVEFPVNQAVTADRWFRTGSCSFGWSVI